ncbi:MULTISPECIES: BatA domain-containing protein [unclassified Paracoccus (in: a-proteobacteria)]|uniref:BatA domain-containing protein n=1 Tax=unclassified Paracoccus (in: a-proteobacteria) TaxID=2688777 RepID=UPI003FA36F89
MLLLGPLGFSVPWLLAALAALPVLWLILRAMPPAPRRIRFPGTRLLLGLRDPRPVARHTPWWLLLIRVLAIAALILGFAGPVWRPAPDQIGQGPLLIVMDAGWAAAPDWPQRQARALRALDQAATSGQPAALLIADGRSQGALAFQPAPELAPVLRGLRPAAWPSRYPPSPDDTLAEAPAGLRTLWLADGLDHPGRADWLAALRARGPVLVVPPAGPRLALDPGAGDQPALRLRSTGGPVPQVRAIGVDPQGTPRELALLTPAAGEVRDGIVTHAVPLDLPSELRNRITRFEVVDHASAGAVVLADDALRRRKVALIGSERDGEGQRLLSPLHYLRRALAPVSDLVEGGLDEVLPAAPDVIVLVDQPGLPATGPLRDWVEGGGTLIRFAGPRMAAATQLAQEPLLPVRLRAGGRDVGGALSWGAPRGIAAFAGDGPFAGLTVPRDALVRAQLLAEPAPDLASRSIASLVDGTPLVTRATLGQGQLVLFHTTANAEWSNLALSGLFVEMLERLVRSARAGAGRASDAPVAPEQTPWVPEQVLDGFGRALPAENLQPVSPADFAAAPAPGAPAGLYRAGERVAALNAGSAPMVRADWPGARIEAAAQPPGIDLRGWLVALAALLLALDALASALLARGRGPLAGMRP